MYFYSFANARRRKSLKKSRPKRKSGAARVFKGFFVCILLALPIFFVVSCGVKEEDNIALSKSVEKPEDITRFIQTEPEVKKTEDIIASTLKGRSKYVLSPFSKKSLNQVKEKIEIQNKTPKESFVYAISRGDTLWSISKKYGVEVEDLAALNNITVSTALKIGKTLKVEKAPTILEYKVKRGDSLWKIAKKYNVSVKKITRDNSLHEKSTLKLGQIIKIKTFEESKG